MKASTTFSILTLAAVASAAKTFSMITIRSGSKLQFASVSNHDDKILLGADGDSLVVILNDDGTLVDAHNGKQIFANDKKLIVEGSQKDAKFGIGDRDYLTYDGKESFVACPTDGDDYQLALDGGCSDSQGVALLVQGVKDIGTTTTTTTTPTPEPTPPADSKKDFGLVAIRSGTKFQHNPIKKVESHPHVFSVGGTEGEDLKLTLKDDGTLVDQNGRGIMVRPSGEFGDVSPWGDEAPTQGFAIQDCNLVLNGKQDWKACPSGDNQFSLAVNDCTGGTGIALLVV